MQNVFTTAILSMLFALISHAADQIPTAAPMTTDLAGKSGEIAVPSVYRIICPSQQTGGTGFLHKSGKIITAAHVVSGCPISDLIVLDVSGNAVRVTNRIMDDSLDLAILETKKKLKGPSLPISNNSNYSVGAQVTTWGYPAGYSGPAPLLSSGYLSGLDVQTTSAGKKVPRIVVNAAFNGGNSGGPLLEIENGTVIGVVSSKLAPMPKHIESALSVLKQSKSITQFVRKNPDGTEEQVSTANVVEEVLQYLRSQVQLVIGYAVTGTDLRSFLKSNGIEP